MFDGKLVSASIARYAWLAAMGLSLATAAPCGVSAQQPDAIPPKTAPVTRIILLGTAGGPGLSLLRSEPANLMVVDGHAYLVDAGEGVSRQLLQVGWLYPPGAVGRIFITHHHVDHNAGLVSLISLTWAGAAFGNKIESPVDIYGPPATSFLVQTALQYLSVSERIFRAGIPKLMPAAPLFKGHDIKGDGLVYSDAHVRVTAAENTHYHSASGSPQTGDDKSYSYRFDTAQGSVVFTGDTGESKAVTRLATGADVLVTEIRDSALLPSGSTPAAPPPPEDAEFMAQKHFHGMHEHMSPEEIGRMATKAGVKTILLTHFVPTDDAITDMSAAVADVKRYFKGTVIAGKDLLEYDLTAPG